MVRGLNEFQRMQMTRSDARIDRMFSHLRAALDAWEDILLHPYKPPEAPAPVVHPQPSVVATPEPARVQPAYVSVKDWRAMSGMGNTATYQYISTGEIKAIKVGGSTRIDVAASMAWLRSRPAAGRRG